MLLQGKFIIVSGIGPGLGIKLALESAREGAKGIAIGARNAERLAETAAQIKELSPDCKVLQCPTDITDRAQCERMAQQSLDAFGQVDALINSAFFHGDMDYASTADLDKWPEVMNTNLLGTLRLTQAVIPGMKSRKQGSIVNINTMAARVVPPIGEAGYAASKAALASSSKFLATELGPHGIRVNNIHMGWMWGAPVQGYMQWQSQETGVPMEDMVAQVASQIPLRRIPTDEECARAALFLASDYASAITGATLDVNGGHFMP